MVGISKKSLDDYVLQIRKGFLYGFNFNQHRHDKIGVLREFNRKKDAELKNKAKMGERKPKRVVKKDHH